MYYMEAFCMPEYIQKLCKKLIYLKNLEVA